MASEPVDDRSNPSGAGGLKLGLCCGFVEEPIRFRMTTARYVSTLSPEDRRSHLSGISAHNATSLRESIRWCRDHGVGAFRVTSRLLPLYTHPEFGWRLDELDPSNEIRETLQRAGEEARAFGLRLSFHPDQFVVLGSVNESSIALAIRELEYQAECADILSAAQLTLHGGGAQGGKAAALERFRRGLDRLSPLARGLIALENDDRTFTVTDLLPVCAAEAIPLVYDVHHHRCNPDGITVEEATALAAATWGEREPWLHISSPAAGWDGSQQRSHADFVDPGDMPPTWIGLQATVDVEAKQKEKAVLRLLGWLRRQADTSHSSRLPALPH